MLRAYSNNITGTSGSGIVFNTNKILTNNSVVHHEGSANITVRAPGFYAVNLDASFTTPSSASAGVVSLQLFADNVAIPDAIITATVTPGEYINGSFSTIIKAAPGSFNSNVKLTVVPTADIEVSSIAIGINRLA